MNCTYLSFLLAFLISSILVLSCGNDPVPLPDPCEGIVILEENVTINGESYKINDPDYSDLLTFIWQFAFDAVNEDCSERYAFSFEFADTAPIYSGSYTTKLLDSAAFLKPDKKEAFVIYSLNRGKNTKIVSGGTTTVNDNPDGSQTITLDGVDEDQNSIMLETTFKFK